MTSSLPRLRIEAASLGDADAIGKITQAAFIPSAAGYLTRDALKALPDGNSVFVARFAQHIVGYMLARRNHTTACLNIIAVEPSWQRLGFGRKMLTWLIDKCKREGCAHIRLYCCASERPQFLYRSLGFVETGRIRRAYTNGDDAICMELALADCPSSQASAECCCGSRAVNRKFNKTNNQQRVLL